MPAAFCRRAPACNMPGLPDIRGFSPVAAARKLRVGGRISGNELGPLTNLAAHPSEAAARIPGGACPVCTLSRSRRCVHHRRLARLLRVCKPNGACQRQRRMRSGFCAGAVGGFVPASKILGMRVLWAATACAVGESYAGVRSTWYAKYFLFPEYAGRGRHSDRRGCDTPALRCRRCTLPRVLGAPAPLESALHASATALRRHGASAVTNTWYAKYFLVCAWASRGLAQGTRAVIMPTEFATRLTKPVHRA